MKKWLNDFNQVFFPMTTACSAINSNCWVVGKLVQYNRGGNLPTHIEVIACVKY